MVVVKDEGKKKVSAENIPTTRTCSCITLDLNA
jgi:hypothetical protein